MAAVVQVEAPALVPLLRWSVILDCPLVTREVRMFSIEAAVRAQLLKASVNAVDIKVPVVLNTFAGNNERLVHSSQALPKVVAVLKLRAGNDVKLLHFHQVS